MKNPIATKSSKDLNGRALVVSVVYAATLIVLIAPSSARAGNSKDVERAESAASRAQRAYDEAKSDYDDAKSNCDDIENGTISNGSEGACKRCNTSAQNGNASVCQEDANDNDPRAQPQSCVDVYEDNGGTVTGLSRRCASLVLSCSDVWKEDALKKCQAVVKSDKSKLNKSKSDLDEKQDALDSAQKNCKECNKAADAGTNGQQPLNGAQQAQMNGAQKAAMILNALAPYAKMGASTWMQDQTINNYASEYSTYAKSCQSFGVPCQAPSISGVGSGGLYSGLSGGGYSGMSGGIFGSTGGFNPYSSLGGYSSYGSAGGFNPYSSLGGYSSSYGSVAGFNPYSSSTAGYNSYGGLGYSGIYGSGYGSSYLSGYSSGSPWSGIGLGNAQYSNSYQSSLLSQQLQMERAQQTQQDLAIYQQQVGALSTQGQQIYNQMYNSSNQGFSGGSGFGGYGGFGGGAYGGIYGSSISNPFSGYTNIFGSGAGSSTF